MKTIFQILVLAISMAFTAPAHAQQILKAHPDRTYAVIKACLIKVGLTEGDDFRLNPEKPSVVQFRKDLFDDPLWKSNKVAIDACWKKQ